MFRAAIFDFAFHLILILIDLVDIIVIDVDVELVDNYFAFPFDPSIAPRSAAASTKLPPPSRSSRAAYSARYAFFSDSADPKPHPAAQDHAHEFGFCLAFDYFENPPPASAAIGMLGNAPGFCMLENSKAPAIPFVNT